MNQEQDNIMILLEIEKNMVKNYSTAITEASNDTLTKEFTNLFENSKQAHRQLLNYALSNGWYQLEQAPQDKISQEQQKLQPKLANM